MSVLGPLFIPRKDIIPVPKIKDNPELEKYLNDLSRRIHTNELMIERWANTAPRLAAVIGICSSVSPQSADLTNFQLPLPLDGPVSVSQPGIVDAANGQLVIPTTGWYTLSATAVWETGSIAANNNGTVELLVYRNGDTTFGHELGGSGSLTQVQQAAGVTWPAVSAGIDFQSLSFTALLNAKDTIQIWAFNFIFKVADPPPPPPVGFDNNTTLPVHIITASLDYLGATPSKVQ